MHPNNRTVKKSEFEHMSSASEPVDTSTLASKRLGGFYNRRTSEPFTKVIGYAEDPYERKEDLGRDEYARLNSKIMYKNQPFCPRVT